MQGGAGGERVGRRGCGTAHAAMHARSSGACDDAPRCGVSTAATPVVGHSARADGRRCERRRTVDGREPIACRNAPVSAVCTATMHAKPVPDRAPGQHPAPHPLRPLVQIVDDLRPADPVPDERSQVPVLAVPRHGGRPSGARPDRLEASRTHAPPMERHRGSPRHVVIVDVRVYPRSAAYVRRRALRARSCSARRAGSARRRRKCRLAVVADDHDANACRSRRRRSRPAMRPRTACRRHRLRQARPCTREATRSRRVARDRRRQTRRWRRRCARPGPSCEAPRQATRWRRRATRAAARHLQRRAAACFRCQRRKPSAAIVRETRATQTRQTRAFTSIRPSLPRHTRAALPRVGHHWSARARACRKGSPCLAYGNYTECAHRVRVCPSARGTYLRRIIINSWA